MTASAIAIILLFLTFLWSLIQRPRHRKLPPGPWALPVMGNLHMLGNLPHRSLRDLAKKYGPIMSMRLGTNTTIVVSSPEAAELLLKPMTPFLPAAPKKLCTLQLLCPSKIEAFAPLRREEVGLLVESLKKAAAEGQVVDLNEKVGEHESIEGITCRMVLGSKNDDTFDVKGIIKEIMLLTGAVNIGDYLPFFSPFDFQKARMTATAIAILLLFLTFLWSLIQRPRHQKPPPGPWALPVIGNLHILGNLPHRSLRDLAKQYGPIMSMRLGTKTTIVVSSPEAAELFLKSHDTIFASRPKVQSSDYLFYGSKDMAFSEYGPYWRHIRKLCTLQLICPSKIETFAPLRREEVGLLVESLKKVAAEGQVVDLSEKVGELIEDIMSRMVLGSKNDDTCDMKGIIEELVLLIGAVNISDCLPFLSPFDFQGLTKRMKRLGKTIDQLLEKIIGEHQEVSKSGQAHQGHRHKDFVDVMLSLMHQPLNPNDEQVYMIDRTNVKAILLDMISGAFDTSATAKV
ncbi:unnamed protein product [Prunus armeniaca]|uniref:Cytochrome P450 n=1 Tax=Prunus armeniaca TaxID=36596 RepID=A0A6J5XCV7_PRUAR|nr:unnamed protein product [Prunus armeniaca]